MPDAFYLVLDNPALRAGLFFIVGLCFGSFATALHYRLPRRMNWISDRSRCPACGHVLGAADLVPVLSWVILRGRCRHCGVRIPARYPSIELGFGAVFALISFL